MNAVRNICIVTGTRAEYGLLQRLMMLIKADPALGLQVVATGAHLSPEFGLTYRHIEADGFLIDEKVEMLLSSDTPAGITKSLGLGTIGFADAFSRLKPDMLVVLGDRFEILAAAQAALIARIPVAHIHGGETSEGAFDESIRHAITKMAQWHFVAAEPYRKRVIQMGEAPERVFNVGAPGLDYMSDMPWLSRAALENDLGIQLHKPLFLITYHPTTLADALPEAGMAELLAALEAFPDATLLFTYPNADTGGRALIDQIKQFVAAHANARAFASLGHFKYLSLMREADMIIGNSSSGIIETPSMKKASVNLGDRQKGRLRAASIIDAPERRDDILQAIRLGLSEPFQRALADTVSPYGQGNASKAIVARLKAVSPDVRKSFFNLEHSY